MKMRTLGRFVLVLLVLAACGAEGGDSTTTAGTDEPEVTTTADSGQEEPATTAAPDEGSTTTSAAEMMDGVHAADTDLGTILVDADGFTLYIFTQDSGGESACYDQCAEQWPPVPGDTAVGSDLDASIFATIERTDGTTQLTVNGMPLYRYTPDTSPGDTNGQGANDVWFVVDATGNMIEAAAADDIAIDYDY